MASNTALSQTIQSLTLSKIRELKKLRDAYESHKAEIFNVAQNCADQHGRLNHLLAGTKELYPGASRDVTIRHIEQWLDQSKYDSSIPPEMLQGFEKTLMAKLDAHSRKLSLADLYARLLTEWMNPSSGDQRSEENPDEDDFLVVEERQMQRLQQLCDQFEAAVFEPLETNEQEIQSFLKDLFPKEEHKAALIGFYSEFLPLVPTKRGEESSKYCMRMYERGIAKFQEAGQPQLAQVYQAKLAELRAK